MSIESQHPPTVTKRDIERYRRNLQGEVDGAAMYRGLAEAEKDSDRAGLFRDLAAEEDRHADLWRQKLRQADVPVPELRPGLKTRLICWLARRFGPKSVLPIVQVGELSDMNKYALQPEAAGISHDERTHAKVATWLAALVSPDTILRGERWHRMDQGGGLRAAVFGVNDGLVSNVSLVMGFAGANASRHFILLAGVSGLLAGSLSMAIGEYISMTAQREMFQRQIGLEREELEEMPAEEEQELALIYRAKGLPAEEAVRIAHRLMENKETALATLAREELGIEPSALGSPWLAAFSSLVMFASGAFVPVVPYLITSGTVALVSAIGLAALTLAVVGLGLSLINGRHPLYSAARQVLTGAVAAAVTFGIGRLIGVTTS